MAAEIGSWRGKTVLITGGSGGMALKASGLSFYRLLLNLAPAALLVGLLHFIVSDQVVPRTARILQEWDAAAAAPAPKPAKGGTANKDSDTTPADNLPLTAPSPGASRSGDWIRDGDSYVRIETVLADGKELRGVTIFERQGHAVEMPFAEAAIDVDKPADLTLAERILAQRSA